MKKKYRGIDRLTGKPVVGEYRLLFDKIPMIEVAAGLVEVIPDSIEEITPTSKKPVIQSLFEEMT
ncbi:MAG: hypothetical protein IJG33_16980 [Selenomonadaceae bacterium]|nr:hypothetical protein [Selenomonadaceae bacterium]MBQ6004773.1 hypothetical protein [Selenomonadaceae bacterium]